MAPLGYLSRKDTHSTNTVSNPAITTLSKYVRKNSNNIKISWSVINKVFKMAPQKPEICSTCNLERMAMQKPTEKNVSIWETSYQQSAPTLSHLIYKCYYYYFYFNVMFNFINFYFVLFAPNLT